MRIYRVIEDRILNSMTRDYKGLQGITKNGGGCGLVGLTQFSTLWPVLLRFARNKDPHSLEVSPHLLPSAGSLLKFTGQICWSNFFHYHLLSGIPAILTHTFNMHVFFLLSISNAKSQLLYACFFLVALLSITVVASPLKLAPRPLAPNVVVLSLGWDETTAFLHGEQRPALFFYNNYGLTAGRDPHGGIYIYPLQRSPKGLQNLGPDNTQLIAYFRDEEQFRSTMATLRDLRALGKLGAGPRIMSWPLITNARDYIHAVLTYLSQLPSGYEGHAMVVDDTLLSEWKKIKHGLETK